MNAKPKPQDSNIICKFPGCIKQLKDYELMLGNGDYCLKHQRELIKKDDKTTTSNNRIPK
jgi:hypothetical protein